MEIDSLYTFASASAGVSQTSIFGSAIADIEKLVSNKNIAELFLFSILLMRSLLGLRGVVYCFIIENFLWLGLVIHR